MLGALQLISRLLEVGLAALPPVGELIAVAWDCAGREPEVRPIAQCVAAVTLEAPRSETAMITMRARETRLAMTPTPAHPRRTSPPMRSRCLIPVCDSGAAYTTRSRSDQLVQLSVAGLVVTVPPPPVAVTPVSAGIEK